MSVAGLPGVTHRLRGHQSPAVCYEPRSNYWGHSLKRNRRRVRGEGRTEGSPVTVPLTVRHPVAWLSPRQEQRPLEGHYPCEYLPLWPSLNVHCGPLVP